MKLEDCKRGDKVWICRDHYHKGYVQVQIINSYPPQNMLPYVEVLYLDAKRCMDDLYRDTPCWNSKPKY